MSSAVTDIVSFIQQVRRRLYVDGVQRRNDPANASCASTLPPLQQNQLTAVPWSWCCLNLFRLIQQYPSGLTWAIVLSELQARWNEVAPEWRRKTEGKKQIIDGIYDTGRIGENQVLELEIEDLYLMKNTSDTYIVTLHDGCSTRRIDWIVHHKYKHCRVKPANEQQIFSLLHKPNKIILTSCRLLQPNSSALQNQTNLRVVAQSAVIVLHDQREAERNFDYTNEAMSSFHNQNGYIQFQAKIVKVPPETRPQPASNSGGSRSSSPWMSGRSSHDTPFQERFIKLVHPTAPTELDKSFNQAQKPTDYVLVSFPGEESISVWNLLQDGDAVGIRCPAPLHFDQRLVYTPDDFEIFLLPRVKEEQAIAIEQLNHTGASQSSQWRFPKTEKGAVDLMYSPEQIAFSRLPPQATNFAFLGRIIDVSDNKPFGRNVSRHILRVAEILPESPGAVSQSVPLIMNVTVWGSSATNEHLTCRRGQIAFFYAISMAPAANTKQGNIRKAPHASETMTATTRQYSQIINVSSLRGLLSDCFFAPLPLPIPPQTKSLNTVCKVKVLLSRFRGVMLIHTLCRRGPNWLVESASPSIQNDLKSGEHIKPLKAHPQKDGKRHYHCLFCRAASVPLNELDWDFEVEYSLRDIIDGSATTIKALGTRSVNERLLGVTARNYSSWTKDMQDDFDFTLAEYERTCTVHLSAIPTTGKSLGRQQSSFRIDEVKLLELPMVDKNDDMMEIDYVGGDRAAQGAARDGAGFAGVSDADIVILDDE